MTLENLKGHNELCGGYSYSGEASFSGTTVKEVLEEIKEFVKGKDAGYIGDGFGNKDKTFCSSWGIRINEIPYVGNWAGWKNKYGHQFDDYEVEKVSVDGGWYCFYDFYIITKDKERLTEEDEHDKAMSLFKL